MGLSDGTCRRSGGEAETAVGGSHDQAVGKQARQGALALDRLRPGGLKGRAGDAALGLAQDGEQPPAGLAEQVGATGARFVSSDRDPMVELVTVQRVAVARARLLGVNPDTPQHLTRSVVLDG